MHVYVISSSLILFTTVEIITFMSFVYTYQHIKSVKLMLSHLNAVQWDKSPEIVLFKRVFYLAVAMGGCWGLSK